MGTAGSSVNSRVLGHAHRTFQGISSWISNVLAEQVSRVEYFERRTQRLVSESTQNPLQNRLDRLLAERQRGWDC